MNLIVAVDENWGIGCNNELLASIPGDMAYFKEKTMNKVVVMGRKTLESLPGKRGLPKRVNIVMTTQQDYEAERCIIVHDDEELAEEISKYDSDDVFLIGGGMMYKKYYGLCEKLYITKMFANLGADTFMVDLDKMDNFEITWESAMQSENGIDYKFYIYERR